MSKEKPNRSAQIAAGIFILVTTHATARGIRVDQWSDPTSFTSVNNNVTVTGEYYPDPSDPSAPPVFPSFQVYFSPGTSLTNDYELTAGISTQPSPNNTPATSFGGSFLFDWDDPSVAGNTQTPASPGTPGIEEQVAVYNVNQATEIDFNYATSSCPDETAILFIYGPQVGTPGYTGATQFLGTYEATNPCASSHGLYLYFNSPLYGPPFNTDDFILSPDWTLVGGPGLNPTNGSGTTVPEPSPVALFTFVLASMGLMRRRLCS